VKEELLSPTAGAVLPFFEEQAGEKEQACVRSAAELLQIPRKEVWRQWEVQACFRRPATAWTGALPGGQEEELRATRAAQPWERELHPASRSGAPSLLLLFA